MVKCKLEVLRDDIYGIVFRTLIKNERKTDKGGSNEIISKNQHQPSKLPESNRKTPSTIYPSRHMTIQDHETVTATPSPPCHVVTAQSPLGLSPKYILINH